MSPVLRLQVLDGICLTVLHKDAYYRYVRKRPTEAEISTVMAELGRSASPAGPVKTQERVASEHHNPYLRCPYCQGDDVYLVPPSVGDPGIYFCSACGKLIPNEQLIYKQRAPQVAPTGGE